MPNQSSLQTALASYLLNAPPYVPSDHVIAHSHGRNLQDLAIPEDGHNGNIGTCGVKFEVQHLQDLSSSFKPIVDDTIALANMFTDLLTAVHPGSRYGWSGYSDKPMPFMGYGPYANLPDNLVHDNCYDTLMPLAEDDGQFIKLSDIQMKGGYDHMENTLGAMIAGCVDPTVQWSDNTVTVGPEGNNIITARVQFVFLDAIPHVGINDLGELRRTAESNIKKWNADWMTGSNSTDFIMSFGECSVGSQWSIDGINLRTKFDAGTLTSAETIRFNEVRTHCGPWPVASVSPFDLSEYIDVYTNRGTGAQSNMCKTMEYPTLPQWADFFTNRNTRNVVPVIISHSISNELMPLYHYYGVCAESTTNESVCLSEYYKKVLTDHGIPGLALPLMDFYSDPVRSTIDIMAYAIDIIGEYYKNQDCSQVDESTVAPEQPVNSTTSVPEAAGCTGGIGCPCNKPLQEGQVEVRARFNASDYYTVNSLNGGFAIIPATGTPTVTP